MNDDILTVMDLLENISLSDHTTMRLGGRARYFVEVHSVDDIVAAINFARDKQLPVYILGGGSNTIATDAGFDGIVVHSQIMGFEIIDDNDASTTVRVGAGENWDETVSKLVDMNLSGVEALSGIPGTVGAAPVQNIGAYGQEAAGTIISVEAYDIELNQAVTLSATQCKFSYRDSIFRGESTGRYIITAVVMRLLKTLPQPPFYQALQDYFDRENITAFTPQIVRDGVLAIRFAKLPDPTKLPNTGSFFKNAIVEDEVYQDLLVKYPNMPHYDMPNGQIKIPTGWMIDQCGLKGKTLHGMHVHEGNALVLINESATSYNDLLSAMNEIIEVVKSKFGITIEREPLLLASPPTHTTV